MKNFLIVLIILPVIYSCSSQYVYQGLVNDPVAQIETDDNHFSILTYNVKAIFNKDSSASNDLFNYINGEKFDIVVFQELFNEQTRDYFEQHVDKTVYKNLIKRIDYDTFPENIFQDSGLFLISKYPQIDLSPVDFGADISRVNGLVYAPLKKEFSITLDFIVNKSVMGSLFAINDSTQLFLFATHMQAIGSDTHKQIQLMQIRTFIEFTVQRTVQAGLISDPQNCIILLTGDFNTDAYEPEAFSDLLNFLGNPRDLHKEFHREEKEYSIIFKGFNARKRFDYIFAYDRIVGLDFKKVNVQSINVTDVRDRENNSISDHFALKASLMY